MLGARIGVVISILLCVGVKVYKVGREDMGHGKVLAYNDGACTLLETKTAVEDMTSLGDGHSVFGGGGDLGHVFGHGVGTEEAGAVWLINATTGTARALEIDWRGHDEPRLVLHGGYYSQRSKRLYFVNHDASRGESVEVFDVGEHYKLGHVASVRSAAFKYAFMLNDVVEGGSSEELYVSQWLPFGFPAKGTESGEERWRKRLMFALAGVLRLRLTRVFRCDIAGECVGSSERFVGANGLAISDDRSTLYVADPLAKTVTALARDPATGELSKKAVIPTKHVVDNLEMATDGTLMCGTIPLPFTAPDACKLGIGASATVGGQNVGCGASPGTLLLIKGGEQTDLLVHDGSKLTSTSSALLLPKANKILLSSPYCPGVLICSRP